MADRLAVELTICGLPSRVDTERIWDHCANLSGCRAKDLDRIILEIYR
jgi:hypothetical protein